MAKEVTPVTVFYSYAHKDEKFRDDLSSSLALLKRQGLIREWHDRLLVPGQKWEEEIYAELDAADLILLLVSRDLINSDFIWGKELKRAMARDEAGTAWVIPIVVRPADWQASPLGALQALPKNGKPITLWTNRDSAWLDVANGIRKAISELRAGVKAKPARTVTPVAPVEEETARVKAGPKAGSKKPTGKATGRATEVTLQRTIYSAENSEQLPGRVVRREGDPATGDAAVDETYDYVGVTYHFFKEILDRDSIDGNGMPLDAIVHYGKRFTNGFWNGKQLILGDGDGLLFNRFTMALDVVAKEYANGVIQHDAQLEYWQQSGVIFDSIAIAFATMVKQYLGKQTVEQADWLIGDKLLAPGVKGRALFSLAQPGTAFDDPRLGKDPQPSHMKKYVKTEIDNGGVHINAGIPNHAFYLAAMALGGYAWEHVGRVWYDTMRDKRLKPKAQFADFARLTTDNARRMFGAGGKEVRAVREAWKQVGL